MLGEGRVAGEVVALLWVGGQVEELGRVVHVVDVFVPLVAEHVPGAGGEDGVVLAEDRPVLIMLAGDVPERAPWQIRVLRR